MLGPLLFLVYINDIPDAVSSCIKIFADDTKLYRRICSDDDISALQRDIDALTKWSEEWQLSFNVSKCASLHVCPHNPGHTYTMDVACMVASSAERDLGIYVDPDLKFRKQASSAVSKASQILALIKRSFFSHGRRHAADPLQDLRQTAS